jgi:hypothetical protein
MKEKAGMKQERESEEENQSTTRGPLQQRTREL